jgi:hypothetical protein
VPIKSLRDHAYACRSAVDEASSPHSFSFNLFLEASTYILMKDRVLASGKVKEKEGKTIPVTHQV